MASLVGTLNMSHGPFTTLPAERWEQVRASRPPYRSDVPVETTEEREVKAARSAAALQLLRVKLAQLRPDVLLVFGDDQLEMFDFNLYPLLAVYVGEDFTGSDNPSTPTQENTHTVPGHPGLAVHILTSLIRSGFDPAFMQGLPTAATGMCHAIMRPLEFMQVHSIPVVPVLINGYFPPQETGQRCYEIGKAARAAVDSYPEELRVVAIGSGGLWHSPGATDAWLDEEFDRTCLAYLERGDIRALVEYFDAYQPPLGDASQSIAADVPGMTGLPAISGPQKGTREIGNWFAAAAMADGCPNTVVDYIPMYSSPIGTAFAYCDRV